MVFQLKNLLYCCEVSQDFRCSWDLEFGHPLAVAVTGDSFPVCVATRGSTVVTLLAFGATAANLALLLTLFIVLCPVKKPLGVFASSLMPFLKEECACYK